MGDCLKMYCYPTSVFFFHPKVVYYSLEDVGETDWERQRNKAKHMVVYQESRAGWEFFKAMLSINIIILKEKNGQIFTISFLFCIHIYSESLINGRILHYRVAVC